MPEISWKEINYFKHQIRNNLVLLCGVESMLKSQRKMIKSLRSKVAKDMERLDDIILKQPDDE